MTLTDFRDWPLHSESRALTFWICSTLVIIQGSQCISVPQCYKLFTIVESEPEIRMSQCFLCDVFWYLFHVIPVRRSAACGCSTYWILLTFVYLIVI